MNNALNNLILKTDSYKLSHYVQYPAGTENVFSYFESRDGAKFKETVFFGLQAFIKKHLIGAVITREKVEQAKAFSDAHVGPGIFNYEGWMYIVEKHGGKLPIRIKAVAEGTAVSTSNVLMTVESTDKKCYWLPNYLETLLVQVWYPSTVATLSRDNKKNILKYLVETGDPSAILFKCHDFGYRGVSSDESAQFGGGAHLVNFMGTDTIAGILFAQEYYGAGMAGFSIPASEHSTMTSWTREGEVEAMRNMLEKYKDSPLIACVSDSWDIDNAAANIIGGELKELVLAHKGTFVVRPDSGNPLKILPQLITTLGDRFGFRTNDKGFLVLNDHVRVIQGDGITNETIPLILEELKKNRLSADNLAFGSGGGLLQHVNRDTQRFAFKCSSVVVNGQERDVYKNPVTDLSKASKKGRLALVNEGGVWSTVIEKQLNGRKNYLETVFEDGKLVKEFTFDEVRANAEVKAEALV
jgi:nicotinamide phosphoribosyltransferase